jgi:hypothetical protein
MTMRIAPVMAAAALLTVPPAASPPAVYIHNGYTLGALYPYPAYPAQIGVDNHDYFSGLRWRLVSPAKAKATGTLNEMRCVPDCADGHYRTYPVEILASDPKACVVTVHIPYSDASHTTRAYVFGKVSVRATSGTPRPDLVGDEVLSPAC